MTGKVEDFKAVFAKRGGMAKQNRFGIFMTPPSGGLLNPDVQGIAASVISGNFEPGQLINDPRDIALLCENCSLPGRTITSIDHTEGKQVYKIPNGFVNEDITFSFYLTQDYYIKKIFTTWQYKVIDFQNYVMGYEDEYTADVVIHQLDNNNIPIYGIRLLKAFPINVSAITLDNAAENAIQKVTVTLSYENYIEEGAISSALSAGKTIGNALSNTLPADLGSRFDQSLNSVSGFVNDRLNAASRFFDRL